MTRHAQHDRARGAGAGTAAADATSLSQRGAGTPGQLALFSFLCVWGGCGVWGVRRGGAGAGGGWVGGVSALARVCFPHSPISSSSLLIP
jgi:hypothetical protein